MDTGKLCASLAAVRSVEDRERAELAIQTYDIVLDRGKASLWAHALHWDDAWMLRGSGKASLRFGVRMGFRERLVSLERFLDDVGYWSRSSLRTAYTRRWLRRTPAEFLTRGRKWVCMRVQDRFCVASTETVIHGFARRSTRHRFKPVPGGGGGRRAYVIGEGKDVIH